MKSTTIAFKDLTLEGGDFVNPRVTVESKAINELADSIRQEGLLYPLQVWRAKDKKKTVNVVVDGGRRLRAIGKLIALKKANGLDKDIPCVVIDAKNLQEARIIALIGNVQRVELTGFEVAREMDALRETGLKGKEIAARVGKSATWVSRQLTSYRNASDQVLHAWKQKKLPADDVQTLAAISKTDPTTKKKVPDHAEQNARLQKLMVHRENGTTSEGKTKKTSRKEAAKARNVAKTGSTAALRPTPDTMKEFSAILEKAPKKERYLKGLADGLRFAIGELGPGEFAVEWEAFAKKSGVYKSDKKAIALPPAKAKKPATKKAGKK